MMFGLLILSGSLVFMTRFDLQISFQTVALARLIQGAGLAFLFVPINTVAYSYLPPEKNNAASGLINLARNVGASMGISFVTTMLDRRQQFHQDRLSAHLSAANPQVRAMLHGTTSALGAHSGSGAMRQAYALLQGSVERQSMMLAYIDNFRVLSIVAVVLIPAVMIVKKPKRGRSVPVH